MLSSLPLLLIFVAQLLCTVLAISLLSHEWVFTTSTQLQSPTSIATILQESIDKEMVPI